MAFNPAALLPNNMPTLPTILGWLQQAEAFIANPWIRALGLIVIVYFTIRVIASVYSGDKQNSEMGPVGIRPHIAQRFGQDIVVLPRLLMPMNMDGVVARLKVFYVYSDARGQRRRQLLRNRHVTIAVSPARLGSVATKIFGHEVPDVATSDVCFPPIDVEKAPTEMPATPDRAQDYAKLHNIVENWHEDDEAPLISMHPNECELVREAREEFIVTAAHKVAQSREGNFLQRWLRSGAARNRPNVIGSYYVKLEFSHNPFFVLTRHPDRDLKMTAWLTVLTSMFALVMDVWPKEPHQTSAVEHGRAAHEQRAAPTHIVHP